MGIGALFLIGAYEILDSCHDQYVRQMLSQRQIQQQRFNPAKPKLSRINIRAADPHICTKPDDAYYANHGMAVPQPAGSGEQHNPTFLFDSRHEDDKVAWAGDFKGTVPVCFLVDTKGNPTNISLYQSPGPELEEHIKTIIGGFRYKPGTVTKSYRDRDPQPIAVQMAVDVVIE